MNGTAVEVGAARCIINNELGTEIQGASVSQPVTRIRDDLEANALVLHWAGQWLLLISCDLAGLEPEFAISYREAISVATGVPQRDVIIGGTHTHAGPSIIPTNYRKLIDHRYLDRLGEWLVEVAVEAVGNLSPAQLGWGQGQAQIGYNRRVCWDDGGHTMHGDLHDEHAIGLEGPDDPDQFALFARKEEGEIIAVLHQNTSHPTCFYGADFLSADFPGAARGFLREALGDIPVLFFNGAFGDISIEDQGAGHKEQREPKMLRAAHLLAGETLRLLHETRFHDTVHLAHAWEDAEIPVRLPDPESLDRARELLARVDAGEEAGAWEIMNAHGPALLQDRFGAAPTDHLAIHAIRLDDTAIITQPCELYCQFGLNIKRRSPAAVTAIFGIADGYGGYCPTVAAIMGGGYSADPFYWSRLVPEGGDLIVDAACRLLKQLWRDR